MLNLNLQPDGTIHYAHRISYTHIDGGINETEICAQLKFLSQSWEQYFESSAGIAKINCSSIPVWHDSLCRNMGEIPQSDRHYDPLEIKWSRNKVGA